MGYGLSNVLHRNRKIENDYSNFSLSDLGNHGQTCALQTSVFQDIPLMYEKKKLDPLEVL